MSFHPALGADERARLARLQAEGPGDADPGEADPGEADPGEADPGEATIGEATIGEATIGDRRSWQGPLRAVVKRVIRKAVAWYVEPAAVDAADRVRAEMMTEVTRVERRLDATGVDAVTINLELLKGEVRSLGHVLDDLGTAIAPAAGLEGAGARLAELRERVNALERRTRQQPQHAPALSGVTDPAEPAPAPAGASGSPVAFDYLGFERRFRGDPEVVLAAVRERYVPLLRGRGPVLDVGCGRGELLGALGEEGVEATGVDLDADMVAEAVARDLDVHRADALAHLRSLPEASLGAIVSLHVIEHLELAGLLELLELSASRLRPGGIFIAETPNPMSLLVLGNSYILDPTHVRPLHPSLMVFLCENAGFRDVRLEHYSPADDYRLPLVTDSEAPPWVEQVNGALERINHVLFGPQEYAVIATTSP